MFKRSSWASFGTGLFLLGAVACQTTVGEEPPPREVPGALVFRGASDASAAVAVGPDRVLVADDETNVLRLYDLRGGAPLASHDLTPFLGTSAKHPEADIEGGARIGDRVYWITSHGRSKRGKLWANRYLFFATELETSAGSVGIRGVHAPFRGLAQAMLAAPTLSGLGLERTTRLDDEGLDDAEQLRLAPQAQGLNIEGLGASPGGDRLYIGLRNPLAPPSADGSRRAIVIPLENPAEVVEGRAAPRFAAPLLWDLGGLGIRGLLWSAAHRTFFIVAGPQDDEAGFALFGWPGGPSDPVRLSALEGAGADWKPEALVALDGSEQLLELSDDGSMRLRVPAGDCLEGEMHDDGSCENKHLRDAARRSFRGMIRGQAPVVAPADGATGP